ASTFKTSKTGSVVAAAEAGEESVATSAATGAGTEVGVANEGGSFEGVAGAIVAVIATLRAARRAARHAKIRRVANQPPANRATTTTTVSIQPSQCRSGATAGGLPVHTGTLGRSFTTSAYSATMLSSSSPR